MASSQCRCHLGKACAIHFFKKSAEPEVYESKKKKFESKKRVPEYEVDTEQHPEFDVSDD